MTGRELIVWILTHRAEDKQIVVQRRDESSVYQGTDNELFLNEDTFHGDGQVVKRIVL